MRFLRTLGSITGAVGFFTGCTALLGTFEVGGSGPDAAALDGSGSDGPTSSESGSDGATDAPAAPLLTCNVDKGNIRLLDTARPRTGQGGGGQLSFDSPHIFHVGPNKTRVVARPSQSVGFTIYEFDPKNGNGSTNTLDIVTSGRIYDVQRADDSIQVLAVGTGADAGRLQVHRIADATFADSVIGLTPIGAVDETSPAGTRGPSGTFAILGPPAAPDYFWAFSTPKAAAGPFDLAIGRSSALAANPQRVVFSSNDATNPASPRVLLAGAGEIFMPLEQDNNGPPTTTDSIIHTPDNAQAALQAVPRSMGKPGGKPNIFFAAGRSVATAGSYNMAFIEVDTASTTAPLTFRLGPVKDNALGSFVAQDVPASFSFDSVTRLPSDGGDTRWIGDHFVATGKGPSGVSGMNFIWYDSTNKALRANQTGPDALLKDRTGVNRTSMTFGGVPTAIFTDFELVWTEAATFDGAVSENLFYASVSCLK